MKAVGNVNEVTPPKRGYSADKDQLLLRLRKVEGQVRGIAAMIQEDRYCIDLLTQLSAAQAALDKVGLALLDGHARSCVKEMSRQGEEDEAATELLAAVARLMRRG